MTTTTTDGAARRAVAGRALLILAALTAAFAAGAGIARLSTAGPDRLLEDAWHAFGLVVFAGLFALVAWRPAGFPGVLELAFAHHLGLALLAWPQLGLADGAWMTLVLDGLLALALLIAYILLGCHRAWRRPKPAGPGKSGKVGKSGGGGSGGTAGTRGGRGTTSSTAPQQPPAGDDRPAPGRGSGTGPGTDPGTGPGSRNE